LFCRLRLGDFSEGCRTDIQKGQTNFSSALTFGESFYDRPSLCRTPIDELIARWQLH
jgi:hypothetical protein